MSVCLYDSTTQRVIECQRAAPFVASDLTSSSQDEDDDDWNRALSFELWAAQNAEQTDDSVMFISGRPGLKCSEILIFTEILHV